MIEELLARARVKGTDKQFREWVQRQPSCLSGAFSEWLEDGTGRCVAAHVRRASNSGVACKPEYSCLPLTQEEHLKQHQHGESALMPKERWDELRIEYLLRWIESRN